MLIRLTLLEFTIVCNYVFNLIDELNYYAIVVLRNLREVRVLCEIFGNFNVVKV